MMLITFFRSGSTGLLMGIVIGLAWGRLNTLQAIGRGVPVGLLVSFAFYSSTGFKDVIGTGTLNLPVFGSMLVGFSGS